MYPDVLSKVVNLGTTDLLPKLYHHEKNCHMNARPQT